MSLPRRRFLRIAGSSAVILAAAGGGAGAWLGTRDPAAARAPWATAGAYPDPMRRALSYAILAPNPHNRQPWLVELKGDSEAVLRCDLDRLLPETDPFSRQIVIGLGCFLELLRQAAAEDGFVAEITPFPEGEGEVLDGRPVALIRLVPGGAPDPLFAQVHARRSNKEPYDTARPVAAADLDAVAAVSGVAVGTTADPALVATLRDLTWRAHVREATTPHTLQESVDLMRIGKAEIEATPDGIDLGGPFLETLSVFGLLDRTQLADPQSQAFQQGMDLYDQIMHTAMAHLWLVTPGNGRADQLAAGRAYVRANLKATELGLAMHPLSQALQEFPEMADLYDELNGILAPPAGHRVQMLARLGYGPDVPASPRWPMESRVRGA